jgi:hypothetical protein
MSRLIPRTGQTGLESLPMPSRLISGLALIVLAGCPPSATDSAFGAFNHTIETRDPIEQLLLLQERGYDGVAMPWPGADAYLSFTGGNIPVLAVGYELPYETDWSRDSLDGMLTLLAPRATTLWLSLTGSKGPNPAMVAAVNEVLDHATPRGARVVLSPQHGSALETAEGGLALVQQINRPGLKLSLHLTDELKAGNADRLAEVIGKVAPQLSLATLNGADRAGSEVLPLDRGDLDVKKLYLDPLLAAGFPGPFILRTQGVTELPEDHLTRSANAWRAMVGR